MQLTSLTNEELLRHAQVDFDPITGSELEAELMRRFAALIDEHKANEAAIAMLDDHGIDPDKTKDIEKLEAALNFATEFQIPDVCKLLDALLDHDIDEPEQLRKVLERDAQMQQVLQDLAEPVQKLHQLVNPTPETTPA